MKVKASLNGQRSTPTNKVNIRCIIFLYFGSVERGAMGAIYSARFPVKINISGIFSLSMSMKGVLKIKTTLYNYGITPAFTTLFWKPDGCKENPLLINIDRWIRRTSIYESIKLLRYYSGQKELNFNNSHLALNLLLNHLWPSGILPRRSTSK